MPKALTSARRAFTIVELMMVVAIIGVLLGIVTSAASSSIKRARVHKANTVCTLVEQGLATYYAQYGKWPGSVGDAIKNGGYADQEYVVLETSQVDEMLVALIKEASEGNPLMDISGLYVSGNSNVRPREDNCPRCHGTRYTPAQGARGLDFIEALRGTKRNPQKMKVRSMHFGYPHYDDGNFMPFMVVYSVPADKMTVRQWHWEK